MNILSINDLYADTYSNNKNKINNSIMMHIFWFRFKIYISNIKKENIY